LAFLDEDDPYASAVSEPDRLGPPDRDRQILVRRLIAVAAGLLILILVILGVRGCLDARKDRALRDYATDVAQIVDETDQTSKSFFGKLSDPGGLSVTEFVAEVQADRSAMDNYLGRIEGLDTPGDMGEAQEALELTYALRAGAMAEISEKMSTALGDVGAEKATASIANQIRKLLASDVLYASVVRPEMEAALADNGIEEEVPESVFVPDDTKWLDEDEVADALGQVSGATGEATPGVHGLELKGIAIDGVELSPEEPASISAEETPELEAAVENQGDSTENGVTVSVTIGGTTLEGPIDTIEPGETATVTIPLTPTPKGEVTIEVEAEPVPGEELSENNEDSFTVSFE
jgi:CARDB protein